MTKLPAEAYAIIQGNHTDPFHYLGLHTEGDRKIVRAFLPEASNVEAIGEHGERAPLTRIHDAGLFAGALPNGSTRYQLRARFGDKLVELDDPYRFPPVLSDFDLYLLGEGTHQRIYDKLGAHPMTLEGVEGVAFVVLAPNARGVSVVGDFNYWNPRRHPMRVRGVGYWELFIPHASAGDHYKFDIIEPNGQHLPLKADPVAFAAEVRPKTASIVFDEAHLPRPRPAPVGMNALSAPMSIYEVHLGSWRRKGSNEWLTYRELAELLPAYVRDLGFTHVEFLPVSEHPFDGSWGYQPTGMFAPTSRFGTPEDFAALVDAFHREGIAVLLDWVPGHFPDDPHGLAHFDGTALYEHADPREGFHPEWNTAIYNHGRNEVRGFLIGSALHWLEHYHADGLRVDAVASMLYRDYSRKAGEWIPNKYGGRENLEAVSFLQELSRAIAERCPGAVLIAEESTAWPGVTRPADDGGLGFSYKWNMGWMHDTLHYMQEDPINRRWHHDEMTFGLVYAFSEKFVMPLSHDEVVYGKGSLIRKMPGDEWQRFANLRAYLGFMWTMPGKKLLFMGGEFAQEREWNHDTGLDWHLLDDPRHAGMQKLVRDLNSAYREIGALHARDAEPEGFRWVVVDDRDQSVFAWLRFGEPTDPPALVVSNFTPVPRTAYRIGVPRGGAWREVINTDAAVYGGANMGNGGAVRADDIASHGLPASVLLTIPPLATVVLVAS
jgi:1,4-alpha-glucan branching enzyme